ncbi:NADAR family protein [Amycolatopsis sp. cmx-4-54]|uniref:NADAR family protein n=1 Tax=Amycolatopsis sp. cmx-4-54 TaxID=2790936 RepID=UPI0039790D9F
MLDVVNGFHGHYRLLSNFHEHPVTWDGFTYPSGEAGYNAGKTLDPQRRAWIAAAPSPGEAKRRGRQVQLRDDWDDLHRYVVMQEVVASKFTDPALRERLLETDRALLIESNTWHDQTWGCCSCPRHRSVPGRNLLGRYLMAHRAWLASEPTGTWTRVALTGHRPQGLPPGSEAWLADELRRISAKLSAEHGTRVAISGAAAGADLIWAEAAHSSGMPVWLYQPYTGHDERWTQDWRDRLTTARMAASRVDTLGTRFSIDVLHARSEWMIRDCDAIIAVVNPQRTSGGTWQALKKVPTSTPIIRIDVLHRRTTLRDSDRTPLIAGGVRGE